MVSDEVSQFLKEAAQLRDQQIAEDQARSKELEEEILAAKAERLARRERARSISPQKSSPATTPRPLSQASFHTSDGINLSASPISMSMQHPQSQPYQHSPQDMNGSSSLSSSPTKENDSLFDAPADDKRSSFTLASPPARAMTWNRRPGDVAPSSSRSRPLSMVAPENAHARQRSKTGPIEPSSATAAEGPFSKEQITQSLAGKDPAWFRQTADRGLASPAFRRNQLEDDDRLDMSSMSAQLPGMSPDPSKRYRKNSLPSTPRTSGLISLPLSFPASANPDTSAADTVGEDTPPHNSPMQSPGAGRTSPNRTTSPTKGLGGFVQSAMMKRSDSVKRWSVTSPPGLARVDSMASNRNSMILPGPSTSTSRPTSRHETDERDDSPKTSPTEPAPGSLEMPIPDKRGEESEEKSPPTSPSKTMDPRRWSPTKSSWLEAALNKPDTPKPKHTPTLSSSQPAWMTELNKTKNQKTPETGRAPTGPSHKHEVSIGGLMRHSPMGAGVKPSVVGLGGVYSPPAALSQQRPITGNSPRPAFSSFSKSTSSVPQTPSERGIDSPTLKPSSPTPKASSPEPEPVKDFRSALRPRHQPTGSTSEANEVAEFKNIFGALRRTKTQNYVAPDELKDNILRGKAALQVTSGPKRTERVDDLKEAILKKKADFKQAQIGGQGIETIAKPSQDPPPPEALSRRTELGRSGTISFSRKQSMPDIPPGTFRRPSLPVFEPQKPIIPTEPLPQSPEPTMELEPEPEMKPARRELPMPPVRQLPTPQPSAETAEPSKPQPCVGGGISERFSANLSSLIARGPPSVETGGNKESESKAERAVPGPGPQLTHMTKNRARGPRRKAPTTPNTPAEVAPTSAYSVRKSRALPAAPLQSPSVDIAEPQSPTHPQPSENEEFVAQVAMRKRPSSIFVKPPTEPTPVSSPASVHSTARSLSPVKDIATRLSRSDQMTTETPQETPSQPSSPRKLDKRRMSVFMEEHPRLSPKLEPAGEKPISTEDLVPKPLAPRSRSQSPTKVPERLSESSSSPKKDAKVDMAPPGLPVKSAATSNISGHVLHSPPQNLTPAHEPPVPLAERPRAMSKASIQGMTPFPELPHSNSKSLSRPPSRPGSPQRSRSLTKQVIEVSSLFKDFFGAERPDRDYNVDAAEVLVNRPAKPAKIKTLSATLFQIAGAGKKAQVPAHNERELFEQNMYLCSHTFMTELAKTMSEVYFWIGDEVSLSAVQAVEGYVAKEARTMGGALVKLNQGTETAEFLQALGGIVIIRRGSSTRYDSLAPSMLCGRRYLNQVTFDEVDFSASNLCSGFPFLITHNGRCYLWIGKGSDVDELSCARLIGMDLTLTGELEEIEDGSEPADFWNVFGGVSPATSADHWRLKPNYEKYCGRLFGSGVSARQQIVEITPFSQRDLSPGNVYILDAFFEMYIIVGAQAKSQYSAFRTALEFAQEYAILASGMEDRPFIPISTVVLEGIPRDLKSVFRKWKDEDSPTVTPPKPDAGGLRRGRSLRIVPLGQALAALND